MVISTKTPVVRTMTSVSICRRRPSRRRGLSGAARGQHQGVPRERCAQTHLPVSKSLGPLWPRRDNNRADSTEKPLRTSSTVSSEQGHSTRHAWLGDSLSQSLRVSHSPQRRKNRKLLFNGTKECCCFCSFTQILKYLLFKVC